MFHLFIIISIIITVTVMIFIRKKNPAITIRINFLDYKRINYYNEISIELQDNIVFTGVIKEKILEVKTSEYKKRNILQSQIKIRNSENKAQKTFKISLYENFTNNINIKINNLKEKFYYSQIIFYGDDLHSKIKINYNFNYNTFNLQKRIRLVICNIAKKELRKIIEKNINDKALNNNIEKVLDKNSNQNLLINIFIGEKNSNILIFRDEKDELIIPEKKERKLIEEFYSNLNFDTINLQCTSLKDKLFEKEKLFRIPIANKNENDKIGIYASFINQGINCLLENEIITKKDKNFLLGYLILLFFLFKGQEVEHMNAIYSLVRKMEYHQFDEIEIIRMATAFTIFCMNYSFRFDLKFKKKLKKGDAYFDGFNFFEDVLKNLNEESEIMLMFLQLNSGFGLELLNNNYCYKISMIPIEEIKDHLINNIPKYFFTYFEDSNDYIISDQRTQILAFNQKELIKYNGNDSNSKNCNKMNVVIGLFHESGHQKFHMNDNVGAKPSPILYIKKDYSLGTQRDNKARTAERGEAGRCIDNYLYGYGMNIGFLFNSKNSYKLMNKDLFTGNLNELNSITKEIAEKYVSENQDNIFVNNNNLLINNNQVNNMEYTFKKNSRKRFDYEYIIINGMKYPSGLNCDCC